MKRVIAVLLSCLLLAAYAPDAASEDFVLDKPEVIQTTDTVTGLVTQKLRISGSGGADTANKVVTIAVLIKGNDVNDPKAYTAFEQIVMPEEGRFTAELLFDNEAGVYTVRVSVQGMAQPIEADVTVPTVSKINEFIEDFRSGVFTSVTMAEEILASGTELSIDTTIFSKLATAKQQEVCAAVLSGDRNLLFEQIKESIDKNTALCAVSNTDNTVLMKEAMSHYNQKYFQFGDDTAYQEFLAKDEAFQREVLKAVGEDTYHDFGGFKEALYETAAYIDFMDISVATDFKKKIETYEEYFDAGDVSDYNNFSTVKKNKVAEYLYGQRNSLDSMEDVAESFSYVVKNYDTLYPSTGQGGGSSPSGGGGSPAFGGGGSQTVEMPSDMNQDERPDENTTTVVPSFRDLGSVPWAEKAITSLLRDGVISGRTSDLFEPEDTITRGEFIKILTGACGLTADGQEADFADVAQSHWAYPYVAAGYSNGIIRGVSDTQFGVDDPITREDMCTIVYRVVALEGSMEMVENPENKFTDLSDASQYAVYSIQMLSSYGIVSGYPDGTFGPKGLVTRAEAAQLIYTFQSYLEGGDAR